MFSWANWQNPETLMLNITNALLGLFVVGIAVDVLWHAVQLILAHGEDKHHAKR